MLAVSLGMCIVVGAVLGFAGAAPFAVVLARSVAAGAKGPGVRSGFICILISAAIILIGAAVANRLFPGSVLPVAVSAALTFLFAVTGAAISAWRQLP